MEALLPGAETDGYIKNIFGLSAVSLWSGGCADGVRAGNQDLWRRRVVLLCLGYNDWIRRYLRGYTAGPGDYGIGCGIWDFNDSHGSGCGGQLLYGVPEDPGKGDDFDFFREAGAPAGAVQRGAGGIVQAGEAVWKAVKARQGG